MTCRAASPPTSATSTRARSPTRSAFTDHLGRVEAAAAKASGAAVIDLTPRICVEDPCPVVVNGMIVFRDIGHLTATFSRSLAPALATAIDGVLLGSARMGGRADLPG